MSLHRIDFAEQHTSAPAGTCGSKNAFNARQFDFYALSLERGPNFGDREIYDAYKSGRGEAAGAILIDPAT